MTKKEKKEAIADHFSSIMKILELDLTDDSLKDTPKRVAKMYVDELFEGLDSSKLPKKKELVVLNKTDLIDKENIKKIVKEFSKITSSEVILLSTLKKSSVSQIKAKLISYAS